MSRPLPHRLDPRRAVQGGDRFEGRLALSRFDRLAAMVEPPPAAAANVAAGESADADAVAYTLAFGRDAGGRETVTGSVRARLWLRCQRCAEPLALDVATTLRLALVDGLDEAAALPDAYEPLLLADAIDGRWIDPRDLIEDELLLALPLVPRHAEGACPVVPVALVGADPDAVRPPAPSVPAEPADDGSIDEARPNPFAVLATLKASR